MENNLLCVGKFHWSWKLQFGAIILLLLYISSYLLYLSLIHFNINVLATLMSFIREKKLIMNAKPFHVISLIFFLLSLYKELEYLVISMHFDPYNIFNISFIVSNTQLSNLSLSLLCSYTFPVSP